MLGLMIDGVMGRSRIFHDGRIHKFGVRVTGLKACCVVHLMKMKMIVGR